MTKLETDLLDLLQELPEGLDTQVGERGARLSGGQKQRIAIAGVIAMDPECVVFDEPTGNLDGENTRIVMDILRRLAHEEGRCVIVVTHDPEVADTADLILRMKDGVLSAL